eukprot:CAMPEP_0170355114 /NCGR_PEP_ID=MMETSP0117_2-20130122/473_1 /TAXON_ID=400756 /ORGANISM="Durinskia baltica, Strain CSIRO CS-38" /LENGTH=106 /DNA_ID=CAMNT_0010609137 /DNA_START=531 /DNA_END=851 /DNA_ORIENTATION=-
MNVLVQVRVVVSVVDSLLKHVPVFGIGRNESSAGRCFRWISHVLDVRGRVSRVRFGEVGVIESGTDGIIEGSDETFQFGCGHVGSDHVLDGGGRDNIAGLCEDPIT